MVKMLVQSVKFKKKNRDERRKRGSGERSPSSTVGKKKKIENPL